jgi:tetratricopeptide (TPR) repeat protein
MPRSNPLFTARSWALLLMLMVAVESAPGGQSSVKPLLDQARTYEARQNYSAAEEQYRQALEISPHDPEVLKRLGVLYQTELKLPESIHAFQDVLASQPQYPQTNFYLGVSYYALNNHASAIDSFEKELATPSPHPKCRYYLALALEAEGRLGEAITQLDKLVAENPKQADALYELARIHKNASLRAIQMLHDLDPDSFQLHALMGEVYADDARYPDAVHEYQAALAKRPDAQGIHYALGIAYWAQNHLAEAQGEFLRALNEDPANAMTNLYLGDIAVKQARFNEALDYLQKSDAGRPNFEQTDLLLGRCYRGLNQPGKAKYALLKAAEEDPTDPQPHYLLAQLYRDTNDADASAREMAVFQKLSNAVKAKKAADSARSF